MIDTVRALSLGKINGLLPDGLQSKHGLRHFVNPLLQDAAALILPDGLFMAFGPLTRMVSFFRGQLEQAWPNFGGGQPESTWRYQWNKHGRCSETRLSQTRYFRKALDLYNSLNVAGALASQRIFPDGQYYNVGGIRGAIATQFGAQPTVHCVPNSAKTETLLYEIYICIDTSLNLANCGGSGHVGCGNLGAVAKYLS